MMRGRQLGAGASQGMAEGDRAAIGIDAFRDPGPPSLMTASDCAAKASFNSNTSMSRELEARHLQRLRNREDWPSPISSGL